MSRLFDDATPDFLEVDTAVVTAYPFTVSVWFYPDDSGLAEAMFFLGDKDAGSHHWALLAHTSNGLQIRARAGAPSENATTANAYTLNAWNHGIGIFVSATDRTAILNGDLGNKATNVVSTTPAGVDRTSVGHLGDSSPTAAMSGRIGEVALWNVALGEDGETAALNDGVSPLIVRPGSLVAYWPIYGGYSPEIDIVGALNLTVTTAIVADHPPVSQPGLLQIAALVAVLNPIPILDDIQLEGGLQELQGGLL